MPRRSKRKDYQTEKDVAYIVRRLERDKAKGKANAKTKTQAIEPRKS